MFAMPGKVYHYLFSSNFTSDHIINSHILHEIIEGVGWAVLPLDFDLDIFGLSFKSWRLFVIILGIPGFIAFVGLLNFPESPKFLVSVGRYGEALEVLQQVYRRNEGQDGSKYPVSGLRSATLQTAMAQ